MSDLVTLSASIDDEFFDDFVIYHCLQLLANFGMDNAYIVLL